MLASLENTGVSGMSKPQFKQVPSSEAVTLKNGDIAMVDGDRLVQVNKRGAKKKAKTPPAAKK
jgi:hypothetical protein